MLNLADVPRGCKAKVVTVNAPGMWGMRLLQMGITPGAEIEVIENSSTGPILIRARGSLISMGRGIARRILVELISH
ncbi:MAG: ferrous iron transport protein A [Sulfolobales archaeon]|nr:ferrous iron transport protein A [Sulfolobales archaeon]MCX8199357.1 ferrous iron transport protein A [Sulfolobales archaeon]MDW8170329.1 FeoA family protein [Desulfurococcaceae archaeon]